MPNIIIQPENAVLDIRTCEVMPRRVRSIAIDAPSDPVVTAGNLKLIGGYSTELVASTPDAIDGGKLISDITINMEPGAGLGRFDGCDEDNIFIRRIKGLSGDAQGNFILGTQDCYRVERPTVVVSEDPRQVTIRAAGLEDIEARAALLISNNCGPCCSCADYSAVWEAIRKLRELYNSLGQRATAVRDLHRQNIQRWKAAGKTRNANPLRLSIVPLTCCTLGVTGGYCNSSGDFLSELELRFTISGATPAGETICGQTFRAGNYQRNSPAYAGHIPTGSREPYELGGSYPTYTARFTGVSKGGLALITFQLGFAGCTSADQVMVRMEAVNPTTGEAILYDATWPKGEEYLPVEAADVHSPLQPGNPCDESSCEGESSSSGTPGSGSSSSSSSSSTDCETLAPTDFTVTIGSVPGQTCLGANCDGFSGEFTVPPGGDSGVENICDWQLTLTPDEPICGTSGGGPCIGVQLDARVSGKLTVYVYLMQACGTQYAMFKRTFNDYDGDPTSLLQDMVIPYASNVGSMVCDLSSALVRITANP